MDQGWNDWPEDEGYADGGDTADLGADLGAADEPMSGGLGPDGLDGYDEPAALDADGSGLDGPHPGDDGAGPAVGDPAGGYLEDDPMGALDEPAGEPEPGPDPDDPAGDGPETVVGADPDVTPDADWSPADFPAQLDIAAPQPVDGYPWSDASAVAAPGTGDGDPATPPDGSAPAQDLLDYAAADRGGDPWAALIGSDDPAASALGRWWAPGG